MIINLVFFLATSLVLTQEINDAITVPSLRKLAFFKVVQTMQSDEDYCTQVIAHGYFEELSRNLNEFTKKSKTQNQFNFEEKTNLSGCCLSSSDHSLFLISTDKEYIKNLKNNQEYALPEKFAGRGIFLLQDTCIFRSRPTSEKGLTVFNLQSGEHSFTAMNIDFSDNICVLDSNLIGCIDNYRGFSIFQVTSVPPALLKVKSWEFLDHRRCLKKIKNNCVAMDSHFPNNILYFFDYIEDREVNSIKLKDFFEIASNNDNYVAAYSDNKAIMFDVSDLNAIKSYEFLHPFSASAHLYSAAFDKTGKYFISGSSMVDSKVYFWSIALKQLLHVIPWFYTNPIRHISISDDNSSLLIQDGAARVGMIENTKFKDLNFLLSAITLFKKIKEQQDEQQKAIYHDH